jgi:Co/Zn/Cd efflux system component
MAVPADVESKHTKQRSTFSVPGMDCPSEVSLIRMALDGEDGVDRIEVDLSAREVAVWHDAKAKLVSTKLGALDLGAELIRTEEASDSTEVEPGDDASEQAVLRQVLAINALMFVVEAAFGWWAESTGLIADGLDMLADASVYLVSLYAVGRGASARTRAARLAGVLQLLLGLSLLGEVGRRALMGSEPVSLAMIAISALALAANLSCVWLLRRHREGGVHMQASWIFTQNDAIANLGVVAAGVLVLLTSSAIPDLVIGALIAGLVLRGAARILRLQAHSH